MKKKLVRLLAGSVLTLTSLTVVSPALVPVFNTAPSHVTAATAIEYGL
jgi:hypothetical protein